jgi:hypothetical protein
MPNLNRFFLLSVVLLFFSAAFSQKVFFKSGQNFAPRQLESFHSSITLHGNLLLFIASDYTLYAYDKNSSQPVWSTAIGWKTNLPVFVDNGIVYSPWHSENISSTAQIDIHTGEMIRLLPVGPLQTKPLVRDSVLFGTAIYEGGNLFAYDIKNDSLLWWQFLAHGVSTQPYYFHDHIQANAEAQNWANFNYSGQLMDTTCAQKADIFVESIPCVSVFGALTHDGWEMDRKFSRKLFGDEEVISTVNTFRGNHQTFILGNDKLAIIVSKRQVKKLVDLRSFLPDTVAVNEYGLNQLLQADDERIQFVYGDQLLSYAYRKKKLERITDLSSWEPSQVISDGKNVWLISKKDGLLYGLSL